MIKAIVFDLDGMIYFTEERWSDWFSRKYNIPGEDMQEFFRKEFKECITGELDAKVEIQKYFPKWKWKEGTEKLFESWFNYGEIDNDMLVLIKNLRKRGLCCILCTNNEKHRMRHFKEKYSFDSLFDYVLPSSELGVKKPEHTIFRKIVDITGFAPEEIMFCDDDETNYRSAKDFGFIAHLFKDIEDFKSSIDELL